MDREHSFITIRLRTDKQLLGTNQTLISRKMQEQVKQQNQTGHVCPDNNWYWRNDFIPEKMAQHIEFSSTNQ